MRDSTAAGACTPSIPCSRLSSGLRLAVPSVAVSQ